MLFVHSAKQSVMVQNLEPNTRYEFVVRLHVDQMSSPWSPVVYHQTLPAGNKLDIAVTSFATLMVLSVYPTICSTVHTQIIIVHFSVNFSASVVYYECDFSVYST